MSQREFRIWGDWRDLRGAIDAADPSFAERGDAERDALWKFAEGVVREYQPLKGRCCEPGGGCGEILPHWRLYRCADCNTTYCEHCIRRHFNETTAPFTAHGEAGAQ